MGIFRESAWGVKPCLEYLLWLWSMSLDRTARPSGPFKQAPRDVVRVREGGAVCRHFRWKSIFVGSSCCKAYPKPLLEIENWMLDQLSSTLL